ncbi:hypothetical protein BDN70DRAFT_890399 [Pholiota conissans]|uniref:Secreted protein n=1 Tax=Pholiota conissans TaxID=109636 RepID=A0A9P5ZEK4_9AGAR|nr:hypothetical protein BDN70DRAFT_890399 [Pholiota conissans]
MFAHSFVLHEFLLGLARTCCLMALSMVSDRCNKLARVNCWRTLVVKPVAAAKVDVLWRMVEEQLIEDLARVAQIICGHRSLLQKLPGNKPRILRTKKGRRCLFIQLTIAEEKRG